jgi:hypothetical protein
VKQNNRKIGANREKLCAEQFRAYIRKSHQIVAQWRSKPARYQSQDLWGDADGLGFDLAFACRYKNIISPYLIQVKSEFRLKYYRQLCEKWRDMNAFCYLAVYHCKPPSKQLISTYRQRQVVKLKDFVLLRVL